MGGTQRQATLKFVLSNQCWKIGLKSPYHTYSLKELMTGLVEISSHVHKVHTDHILVILKQQMGNCKTTVDMVSNESKSNNDESTSMTLQHTGTGKRGRLTKLVFLLIPVLAVFCVTILYVTKNRLHNFLSYSVRASPPVGQILSLK